METTTLDLHRLVGNLDDQVLLQLAEDNPHLVFERDPAGRLVVTPPLGGESARRELALGRRLAEWNDQHQAGAVFSSQVLFRLPSGALRGPDASWVDAARWQALSPAEREGFPRSPPTSWSRSAHAPMPAWRSKARWWSTANQACVSAGSSTPSSTPRSSTGPTER